jgi:hypothetical protein
MPIIYASITIDKALADDMILNYKDNLINIIITKHAYDSDDTDWSSCMYEEDYISGQCEYFTDDKISDTQDLDYIDSEVTGDAKRKDVYRTITIGLMRLALINGNKKRFNMTLYNTTMTNAIMTTLAGLNDVVMQPLVYDETLSQVIVPSVDSISKAIDALNNVRVLYDTPYRFFMDFNATYLLASDGTSVPRKGQRITDLLISVKKATDVSGMIEGVYINKSQKNYQINISSTNFTISDNQTAEKTTTDVIAISTSGYKQEESLDIDKSSSLDSKTTTVSIPNDNLNMIQNIKAQAETNTVRVNMIKDNVDGDIIDINGIVVIHNLDDQSKYNGQYLLSRKRELFMSDGFDFTMTVIADYKKLNKVV